MKAKLSAYVIKNCGLYKSDDPDAKMAKPVELFLDYLNWSNRVGMTVALSKTYNAEMPAYTYNISSNSAGDYLVTLWNESPVVNGRAAAVRGNDAIGNPTIDTSTIRPGGILGYPTYFYILPNENIFFTLQVNSNVLGIRNFGLYIKGFLDRFSKWAVLENGNDRLNSMIVGYKPNGSEEPEHFYARFNGEAKRKTSDLNTLRNNYDQITKLIKVEEFHATNLHSSSTVRALLSNMGIRRQLLANNANYKYEINFAPTLNELNGIISRWENEEEYSHWKDVGFKFRGVDAPFWLAKMLSKVELDLDVRMMESNGVLNSQSLLNILALNKASFLRSIRDE